MTRGKKWEKRTPKNIASREPLTLLDLHPAAACLDAAHPMGAHRHPVPGRLSSLRGNPLHSVAFDPLFPAGQDVGAAVAIQRCAAVMPGASGVEGNRMSR